MSKVAILLSTYNGAPFIEEQINSLLTQSHQHARIIARDDGSIDDTRSILINSGIETLPNDQNLGAQASYFTLLQHAVKYTNADYFMFCDQDDVWKADKIEITLSRLLELEANNRDLPALVHSDLEVVDQQLNTIASSMWKYEYILPYKNSFSRLLIQNTVTGCTTMINRSLAEKCLTTPPNAIMHDWWLALIASYFGRIGIIESPTILYRQHQANTIGTRPFKIQTTRHFLGLLRSIFSRSDNCVNSLSANIDQASDFLQIFETELDDQTREILSNFINIAHKNHFKRKLTLLRYNLLRQGFTRNISLILNI